MNVRLALKSPRLVAYLLAAACCLSATDSKPDEPATGKKPETDSMRGKEPGDVRDHNDLKMKLVWCPPGTFTMGSPKTEARRTEHEDRVEVTLTKGYWLGKYEVTQSEWKQVMASEPWKGKEFTKEGDDLPATHVSWEDAIEFCRRLTVEERKAGRVPEGWEYSLPTDAQWERACRASTETMFSFGDDSSQLGEYAWFGDNAGKVGKGYGHPVGQKKPNPWGLHDIHGNVWEWCRDVYAEKLPGGRDPEVTEKGSDRVVRGGGCTDIFRSVCRSAFRGKTDPSKRSSNLGFRVALSPSGSN